MNWQNKDAIKRALLDMAAFLVLCAAAFGLMTMMSGCKSAPAHTVDNTTVTTEITRTEYAPDGSVAAVEVHKEIVKNDVVTETSGAVKEKKKGIVPWWLPVLLVVGVAGGSWYFFKNLPRKI